jgi:NitT/TauT family transport system permease protein
MLGFLTICIVLTLWQVASISGFIDRAIIPPASLVFQRFAAQWVDATFYPHLWATLFRIGVGFALAAVVAIPIGLFMGYWSRVYRLFALTIDVLRPIPASAFVPLALIIFGIGNAMHIFVVFIGAVFPILLASIDSARAVDPALIGTAKTLGRDTKGIFRTVVLPAAMPYMVTGLRIGMTQALVVAVSSEMILSSEGLGYRVLYAQRIIDVPGLYAGVLTLAFLGYLLNRCLLAFENHVVAWHRQANIKVWK